MLRRRAGATLRPDTVTLVSPHSPSLLHHTSHRADARCTEPPAAPTTWPGRGRHVSRELASARRRALRAAVESGAIYCSTPRKSFFLFFLEAC